MWVRVLVPVLMVALACTGEPSTRPDEGFWPFTAARVDAGPASGEPFKVGAIFSTSGGIKWLDTPGLKGFRLAADEINATGGVRGRPIEVVHVDGKTHPLDVAAAVQEMIDRGVVALGGVLEPTYGLAPLRGAVRLPNGGLVSFDLSSTLPYVQTVAARAGVPLVSAGALEPSPGVFMFSIGMENLVRVAVSVALEQLDARTAWILTDDGYRYTTSMAAHFRENWIGRGGRLVGETTFPAGSARHINEQLSELRGLDAPPDAIFLAAVPNELGILMEEIRGAGLDMPVISAAAYDSPYIAAFGEENADGLWFSTDASLLDPDPRVQSFRDRYEDAYDREPEHLAAMQGYDTMRLIGWAIEQAGSAQPASIAQALTNAWRLPVLGGTVSYARHPDGTVRWVPGERAAIMRAEGGRLLFEQRL